MAHENCLSNADRRTFLQAGAVATAAALAMTTSAESAQDAEPLKVSPVLPKRPKLTINFRLVKRVCTGLRSQIYLRLYKI